MGGLLPTLAFSVFLLAASPLLLSTVAEDGLTHGRLLSINQTIVSAGGTFALGFFSPESGRPAARRYVGVWYNNIPAKTVVWVANREKPLMDSRGVFTVARDGNVVLLDGRRRVLWSSNVSGVHRNASAVLQNTGNLVLTGHRGGDDVLWQSFDHPADTMLPEMKLWLDVKTGAYTRLVSWRAADDPSPGNFSMGFDPETYIQVKTWRGSESWTRGPPVEGNEARAGHRNVRNTTAVYVRLPEMNSDEISTYFTVMEGAPPIRITLDTTGVLRWLLWVPRSANWSVIRSRPGNPCDFYGRCGPSGLCNSNGTSVACSCLKGFVPLDLKWWNRGKFSGGCVRRVPLRCDQGDKFLRLGNVRVPDRFVLIRNVDAVKCQAECLRRCNCTAYSYSNITSVGSSTRCLVWAGEMLDMHTEYTDGSPVYELNVRLVQSELDDGPQTNGSSKKKILAIALATFGAVVLLLGILGFLLRRRLRRKSGNRRKKNSKQFGDIRFASMLSNGENMAELHLLDFSSVLTATDNFSSENKLGEGGFGPVYKGKLPDGEMVAIKRLSKCSGQGLEEFKNEVELIARLQHTNIVQLLGWCLHENEMMLIYEFLPNRSLDKFIFDPSTAVALDWEKRFRIIKGIAQGLLYLHRNSRLHVVHRDMKTSNILLDDAMNAKISDFGLARMFQGNQKEANTGRIVGTYGYMSPEYALDGHFSEKSDVFSFGVILLEIISGRRNTGFYAHNEALTLLGYAWKLWNENRVLELVDPSLGADSCAKEEVSRCIHISLMCVQEAAAARPTTPEIVGMLGAENATLPAPKHPAFVTDHNSHPELPENGSINFLTISAIDGR